jgi:cell fate regulator YaaT (PSP1 superfamily)
MMYIELPVLHESPVPEGAARLAEVGFKGNRRDFYACTDPEIHSGDWVVVESDRGEDLGRVSTLGGVALAKCGGKEPTRRVLRRAVPPEVERLATLRADEERVRRETRQLAQNHGLKMKISEAEWQWDRNKLIIYFTAERRVDFRQLVRELARTFRTRIELRQIGVRDEAALLGGVGRCGRQLCCATWLREIRPISLQLAKNQGLSLNPQQISGTCGRLMCCLTYEHDMYLQARRRFPREGKTLRTSLGQEKVLSIDIWKETVTLLEGESRTRRVVALAQLRKEMEGGPDAPAPTPAEAPAADPEEDAQGLAASAPPEGQRRGRRPRQRRRD